VALEDLDVELTMRYSKAEDYEAKQVIFGVAPLVFILPQLEEDGSMLINVDTTDFDTTEDVAQFLETVASILRQQPEV